MTMAGAVPGRGPATGAVVLHDYWRSSASYRVRIALALKGIGYDRVAVDLVAGALLGGGCALWALGWSQG